MSDPFSAYAKRSLPWRTPIRQLPLSKAPQILFRPATLQAVRGPVKPCLIPSYSWPDVGAESFPNAEILDYILTSKNQNEWMACNDRSVPAWISLILTQCACYARFILWSIFAKRPLILIRCSAWTFLDSYLMCLSYLFAQKTSRLCNNQDFPFDLFP